MNTLRNIAIIAHVDHGKTTLVDKLLSQSGSLQRKDEANRIMDSHDLEKERGITISSKNCAMTWEGCRINVVDTPGHADFGGEVERILSMVDSVLLLVDAVEGPMPQTRFVTQKAFAKGLKPIVVVNKVDRPGARPDWVVDQVFDLFDSLDATDEQLDFPIVYASAIEGFAVHNLDDPKKDMTAIFEAIVKHCPEPKCDPEAPFQMQVSALDYSSYVGAIGIGRVHRGTATTNMQVTVVGADGKQRNGKLLQILTYQGLERNEVKKAEAGDIIAITGIEGLGISDTICDKSHPEGLPLLTVDEPTVNMTFSVNTSPFAGKEGKYVTSRQIKERLDRELIHNVALKVEQLGDADKFKVSGRGELHLSILIETMRREGFELAVSRPEVIIKEVDGEIVEPYELLSIDIEQDHQGGIMTALGERRGELKNMVGDQHGRVRLDYDIPTRGLIGFHTLFLTLTSGTGIQTHVFDRFDTFRKEKFGQRAQGALISNGPGTATGYSLFNLQPRGKLCIDPQTNVYEGMIVGIHQRDNDLVVNVIKGKQLTNVRASGTDENIQLTPPIRFTLEQALEFINDDELVEVTPKTIRLRKVYLTENERKRKSRSSADPTEK